MPFPWFRSARRGRAQSSGKAPNAILVLASVALLATGLISPVAAQSSAASGLASARHTDIARTIGRGTRVDARLAARDAAKAPRVHREFKRLKIDLGARPATKVPAASPRNMAGTTRSGDALGIGAPRIASQPAPVITTKFAGIAASEVCTGCEPPDPWIAVSTSYVVQSTNGMIRVSNRAGSTLMSEPTWALFAVPVDRFDSDPRILWDAVHARWVGVLTTFNGDFSQNGLRLAISETADPTAGWIVYSIDFYGIRFPDYPGISSSTSRIVLTSNDFIGNPPSYVGPTWLELDWSNILAGTDLFLGGQVFSAPSIAHFRPAITLSPVLNTPVIYEAGLGVGAKPGYFEIGGTAHAPTLLNVTDLTTVGASPFSLPTPPVQPGAVAIANANDERPTDAVYRSGSLWFVATGDNFDGVNHWDMARYTLVPTTANNTAVTSATDIPGEAAGIHFFTPGVGINADGSVFVTATKTDPTSIYPTTVVGAVLAGSGISPYVDIEASTNAYIGSRWGDYVGVAADPSGAGAVWIGHELAASDGTWRTSVIRVVSDGTPPGVPGAIVQFLIPPASLGATVPVRTSWGAAIDADSGVAGYLVERSDDGGGFFGVRTSGTSITQPLLVGHAVQYRISAIDAVGNVGSPRYGPLYRPTLYQQGSAVFTGTWPVQFNSVFSGGSARYASIAGRYATFTATSARSIAIVTTRATTRGSFRVYVDGHLRATIRAYSLVTRFRQLVFSYSWATAGTHKIRIIVLGTAHHPRVDVDAFVVLR